MFTEVLTQGMRGNSMNIGDGKGSSGEGVGRRRGCSRIFPEEYYPIRRLTACSPKPTIPNRTMPTPFGPSLGK